MPKIDITRMDDDEAPMVFHITVEDADGSSSQHSVNMDQATFEKLRRGEATPEDVIDAAFRYLLDRESKESILTEFDVTTIGRYFPGYEDELPDYL